MEGQIIDSFFAPALAPAIMSIHFIRQLRSNQYDPLYAQVAVGTFLSASCGIIQFHMTRRIRNRVWLTLMLATFLTMSAILSIVGFCFTRLNFNSTVRYYLPLAIRDDQVEPNQPANPFRYHFHADIIPGLLVFSQTQLCAMIKFHLACKAKRTFTFGESSMVAQLVSAVYLVWALNIYTQLTGAGPFTLEMPTEILLNLGMIIFSLVFLPAYVFLQDRPATLARYALLGLGVAVCFASARKTIGSSSNLDPLTWLVDYIFSTHQKISLFSLWLSIVTACVSVSTSWTRMVGQTNCLVRKVFHVAVCVVFISGYHQDLSFTRFAAGGVLLVMLLLEIIRAWDLSPAGPYLEKTCNALRGKWDNKYLTVSHMYLVIGIFLPLWLLPNESTEASKLLLFSGVLSIGIGDTAAAVVGTFWGKKQIGKTGKTYEGLVGNMVAMMLAKLILVGFVDFSHEFGFIMATVFAAFTEAVTQSCDNLILPLVTIFFLEICC